MSMVVSQEVLYRIFQHSNVHVLFGVLFSTSMVMFEGGVVRVFQNCQTQWSLHRPPAVDDYNREG